MLEPPPMAPEISAGTNGEQRIFEFLIEGVVTDDEERWRGRGETETDDEERWRVFTFKTCASCFDPQAYGSHVALLHSG
jgi:hypothetical protein